MKKYISLLMVFAVAVVLSACTPQAGVTEDATNGTGVVVEEAVDEAGAMVDDSDVMMGDEEEAMIDEEDSMMDDEDEEMMEDDAMMEDE